jgi:hypothetical protein
MQWMHAMLRKTDSYKRSLLMEEVSQRKCFSLAHSNLGANISSYVMCPLDIDWSKQLQTDEADRMPSASHNICICYFTVYLTTLSR